ncbi:MAG: peptide chain release factor N(5)-glutamine methyltransferase [Clostridiales bacterium]|nr:peptide chain release factor N(5)-glutamine methyltransferase [Clostridiales bacterium]
MNINISEAIREAKIMIEPVAHEEALQQAKIFVSTIVGIDVGALPIHADMKLVDEQITDLGEMLERRLKGEPLQYILGEWEFFGLPFYVDSRALIPRQDTELLVETAIRIIRDRKYYTCLDLCTGTGCIGISIVKNTDIQMTASDISRDALALAKENADLNDVNMNFVESDVFQCIDGKFDLIVCNPPYLSLDDMQSLQQELTFEPKFALYGGGDGLDFYRRIAREYRDHLNKNGMLLLEIGSGQTKSAASVFDANTSVLNDLGGNPRVLVVEA